MFFFDRRVSASAASDNPQLIHWIRDQSLRVEAVIGICSGAVSLAECGLLKGCHATTHPQLCCWMHQIYPDVVLTPERTLVDAGHVITATGWKGAFQAALRFISRTDGLSAALSAASSFDPGNTWVLPASTVPVSESAGSRECTE
jgi:transcriptional regulator GlxA family with amidase domain